MAAYPQPPLWAVDAYLEMERGSPIKHEYLDGHVYAMAGGTRRHSRIGVNVTTLLDLLLRDSPGPCQAFNSDMMARVDARNYTYPDASVTCDPRDTADDEPSFISHPTLIVDVLSDDSTAGYDRGDKFTLLYQRIDALREYVLVETRTVAVDVYRGGAGQPWVRQTYGPGDDVVLESVAGTIPIAAFYERVVL